ncbi:MAG TPA: dihydrofolate reductase family protein [Polyangiaceae bacterium]
MQPLELLFERPGLPRFDLSPLLSSLYGGDFGLGASTTYANFVSSLDGVVTLPAGGESGRIVSGDSEADRFVMALLRACADAVVIGAGTFRQAPGAFWHAADAFPSLAGAFAELRAQLGLRPHPLLVLVTASGQLDTTQPAARNALVATTEAGGAKLRGTLPEGARLVVLGPREVPLSSLLGLLRSEGLGRVLTEGGPTLLGELMNAGLVDELFLTTSPRLFGRSPGDGKKSLIHGVELDGRPLELSSVRRQGSHLFLRYATR